MTNDIENNEVFNGKLSKGMFLYGGLTMIVGCLVCLFNKEVGGVLIIISGMVFVASGFVGLIFRK